MTPSWQTVRFGLRLIMIGAQMIGWSLAAMFAIGCGGSALIMSLNWHETGGWLVLGLIFTTFGTAILGRLLCAIGRWVCVATPPEAPKARARIRLTVIFETCSLLSGAVTIGLIAFGAIPSPEFATLGAGFWLLTTVLGRVCFFAFGLAVAEDIRARTSSDDARLFFRLSLFAVGAAVFGTVLLAIGNLIGGDVAAFQPFHICGCVLGFGLLFVASGLALYLFFAHFILITDLRRHLDGYTPKPSADDPDREYLERHLASGGSANDT